jgi:hypothetical protein
VEHRFQMSVVVAVEEQLQLVHVLLVELVQQIT